MKYVLMLSLEHIALVKIATILWNQEDIRALVAKFSYRLFSNERIEEWQEIENKVKEKVPQLSQPESLKEELLGFIKPIGLQIIKWMEYHRDSYCLAIQLPNELCWTPQGTVHRKKTAESLIKNENLDIIKRYKLACIYCLEDYIPELWNKMPENHRKSFYSEKDPNLVEQDDLVIFWTYAIKGEVTRMSSIIRSRLQSNDSLYLFICRCAAYSGNKVATEYFLQKLTPIERKKPLVLITGYVANKRCDSAYESDELPKEHITDVLCLLLSQLDEEQQIEVFQSFPCDVLECLLDWPWQSFFTKTANRMWDLLSVEDYNCLLCGIVKNKIMTGYKDYNYQMLFEEFWQKSPNTHKKYVIDACAYGPSVLVKLFEAEDVRNIRLILKDATVSERNDIIFCAGHNICESLINDNKWDLLKFFVGECISSKEIMIEFKKHFMLLMKYVEIYRELPKVYTRGIRGYHQKNDKWNKFYLLLDDLFEKDDKKSGMEECKSSQTKRHHSTEFEEVTVRKIGK